MWLSKHFASVPPLLDYETGHSPHTKLWRSPRNVLKRSIAHSCSTDRLFPCFTAQLRKMIVRDLEIGGTPGSHARKSRPCLDTPSEKEGSGSVFRLPPPQQASIASETAVVCIQ